MKKKTRTLVVIYTAALIAVLGGFVCRLEKEAGAYRRAERHAQLAAVSQLSDSLAQMSTSLTKGMYASSPELLTSVSAEIWNHSAEAIASMARLPLSDVSLEQTETFISRAGDFAYYIARCAAAQRELSGEERAALRSCAAAAESLSMQLMTLQDDVYAGNVLFAPARGETLSGAARSFSDIEEQFRSGTFTDYDGSMSAHVAARRPQFTRGTSALGAEDARKTAARILETGADELTVYEGGGTIPTYTFSNTRGDTVTLCRNGGSVLSASFTVPENEREREPGEEELRRVAEETLEALGFDGMRAAWRHSDGGVATYRFVYEDGGVRVYPDSVTVAVSEADGSVVSLHAEDYVMNHHARSYAKPKVTQREAKAGISDELSTVYTGRAVVHSPGFSEVECYEFLCRTPEGRELLLYCDTQTGRQCRLTLLSEDEDGTILS